MKAFFCILLGLMGGTLTATAQTPAPAAQAPSTEELMAITKDNHSRLLIVTALVGNTPMRMILDTGATHTILHKDSVAKIKKGIYKLDTSLMKFEGNVEQRPEMVVGNLQVGPALSPQHPLIVLNLAAVRSMMGEEIDGIVGMDILGAVPFTFDFKSGEFYWGITEGVELTPLRGNIERGGRMMVQASCGGKEIKMLLDTGSAVTRVNAQDWAPGEGAEIMAQLGNVNDTQKVRMTEGAAGDLEIAKGVILKGVTPLLDKPGHSVLLGLDALQDSVLIHLPTPNSPYGKFFIAQ